MANKAKMISVNAFEKATKSIYEPTTTVSWNGLEITVKKHLTLAEVSQFVNICVKACFNSDTAAYSPEAKDAAIRSCVVGFYTNITLPDNVEKQYELIYCSAILNEITPCIDQTQLKSVVGAVDEKIDYLARINTAAIDKQVNDLLNIAEKMQKDMTDMFNGFDADDIKKVMRALSENGLDEKKLVEAYMENKKQA